MRQNPQIEAELLGIIHAFTMKVSMLLSRVQPPFLSRPSSSLTSDSLTSHLLMLLTLL